MRKTTNLLVVLFCLAVIFGLVMVCVVAWQQNKIKAYQPEKLLALPEKATYCENKGFISDKYKIFAIYREVLENDIAYEFYNANGVISYGVCKEKELGVVELIEKTSGERFGYAFLQGDRLSLLTEEDVLVLYRGKQDIALISGKVPE